MGLLLFIIVIMSSTRDIAKGTHDIAHSFTSFLIYSCAKQAKASTLAIAYKIPGFCHTHLPTTTLQKDCVYCQRYGNCFDATTTTTAAAAVAAPTASVEKPTKKTSSTAGRASALDATMIETFRGDLKDLLVKYTNSIFDELRDSGIDSEAMRAKIVSEIEDDP